MKKFMLSMLIVSTAVFADKVVLTCNNLTNGDKSQSVDATMTISTNGAGDHIDYRDSGRNYCSGDGTASAFISERVIDLIGSYCRVVITRETGAVEAKFFPTYSYSSNTREGNDKVYTGICVKKVITNAI